MDQPLEKVRAKVIEAVPEIVALNLGCVLESKDFEHDDLRHFTIVASHGMCLKHKTQRGCENSDGNCDDTDGFTLISQGMEFDDFGYVQREVEWDKVEERYVVVGRAIRLSDVLVALGNCREVHGLTFDVYADKMVIFWSTKNGDGATLKRERWNLRADSLDEQSPETIAFLHKILCV